MSNKPSASRSTKSSQTPDLSSARKSEGRRRRRRSEGNVLETFRRETGGDKARGNTARPPVSLREKIITGCLAVALVVPPWLKGSTSQLAHWLTLSFVLLAFLWLWIPMGHPNILNLNTPPSLARKTLFHFPIFWLGLLLLGYVLTAALNPGIEISLLQSIEVWKELDFIPWLPAGIDAPLPIASSWKVLLQWGTLWLAICALWAGCRRRRSIHFLFWSGTVNAAVVGLIGAAHSFSGNIYYLWGGDVFTGYGLFGPFLYDNHAAAYLVGSFGLACSLTLVHLNRSFFSRNGSHIFLCTAALVILATIFVTRSRAGVIFASLALVLMVFLLLTVFRRNGSSLSWAGLSGLVLVTAGIVAFASMTPWKRLRQDFASRNITLEVRMEATKKTYEIWQDSKFLGSGPGSFRYVFPGYQDTSEILSKNHGKRHHWQHAHNDWVEGLAELGLVGYSLLIMALLWVLSRLLLWRRYFSAPSLMAFGTGGLVLAHAGLDFVLQNPAVTLTLAVLVLGTLRLIQTEREVAA